MHASAALAFTRPPNQTHAAYSFANALCPVAGFCQHVLPCLEHAPDMGVAWLAGSAVQQAQELAQQAGFVGALAKAYHLGGNFMQALECALHSPSGQPAIFRV